MNASDKRAMAHGDAGGGETTLADERCTACRSDSPRVSRAEIAGLLTLLPGWKTADVDGVTTLSAEFAFATFRAALNFANRIGDMADAEDHHPEIVVEWGQARVRWWTHTIRGLHRNDFILAARTSALYDTGDPKGIE